MAALQAYSLLVSYSYSSSPSSSSCSLKRTINASIQPPKPSKLRLTDHPSAPITKNLYAILEDVEDRVEMHENIGEQRDNWNKLLLNSVNMMTLTATTMAAMAAMAADLPAPSLRACSALLFTASTGMSLVMSKIQPSQLAEEQRNASRLFKQLQSEIKSMLALQSPTESNLEDTKEKVLALDRAYPLPLLGAMLEKFPMKLEPATWKPRVVNNRGQSQGRKTVTNTERNGWSEELEEEMRAIVQVLKSKDKQEYLRLGNLALKLNKMMAVSAPLLAGMAAAGSAFGGSTAMTVAAIAGAMATIINIIEHGGQVGMVVEMYRNCAGFFDLMEQTIEATLEESDYSKRENGEMFEMRVAMKLGRSSSQLRDLARKSRASGIDEVDEFGSKLF